MSPFRLSTAVISIVVILLAASRSRVRAAEPERPLGPLRKAEELTNKNQWPEAAAAWQQVVDRNPHLGRAWQELGRARYRAKDYRQAIPAMAKALELRAGYPANSAYDIACCHALLGENEPALEWLRKALDLGFRRLRHIREDDDLKSLRDDERFKTLAAVVDVDRLSRDEGWRFDLDLLAREIKRSHYAPFRKVSREAFDAEVRKLREAIPRLTDNQIEAGFRKLLALVGDGHTSLAGDPPGRAKKDRVPVEFYLFTEGLFLTSVQPRYEDLAGAQVLNINGHKVDEVLAALDPVISQDNHMGLSWRAPECLRSPRVLNGLGLIPDDKSLTMTVRDARGRERTVTLPADSGDPEPSWVSARRGATAPEPSYLKKRKIAHWFEYLPALKLVYFQYNEVSDRGDETLAKFSEKLFRFIGENDVNHLVIDLRWNGGGNNFLNQPLVHGLIRCDKVNREGGLFVIVGRNTFSAAMCGSVDIERHTKAVFVGEPTGSSPNFVGESAVIVEMPHSKLRASISDLYWENSVAMDYRTWIAPEIYTPPTFAAFSANRDPAMEAILAQLGREDVSKHGGLGYTIRTVAGNGEQGFGGDGGPATAARLNRPCAVATDEKGNLFIADYGNNRIRKVGSDGTIATLAGTGEPGYSGDNGPAAAARLQGPYGVCVDRQGSVYVADQRNDRVRKIATDGTISSVAGNGRRGFSGDGGPATSASLAGPDAMAVDDRGDLYIADAGNHRVRKVTAVDGIITTVAGTGAGYSGDGGPATRARLNLPASLAFGPNGNLYIGDLRNHVIREVTADGVIRTVAGTGTPGFEGDGSLATRAKLNEPGGVGVAPDGSLLIADGANFRVRRVGTDGVIRTIAGSGDRFGSANGGPAEHAGLSVLDILAVDRRGNVYVTDHGRNRIHKLTPDRPSQPDLVE